MTLPDIVAHLRFQLHRHGWPAMLGLALIVVAAVFQFFVVTEVRTHADALRAEQAVLRKRLAEQANPQEASNRQLAAFYAGLPVAAGADGMIETIHRAAAANDVTLTHGEYHLTRDSTASGMSLLRYQITLPARASYPQLRAWLADVMNAAPTMALDELSFQRDTVGSGMVESRVRLTLFLKAS